MVNSNRHFTVTHGYISTKDFQSCDRVFDGLESTLLILDDLMSKTSQLVANIFTKISHHSNISILHFTQNLFDNNKYARTISLNAHYLVLFKNPNDASQFATLARKMYPNTSKFAIEAYKDATNAPYGYLLIDLKPEQNERCRLRTNVFPGGTSIRLRQSRQIKEHVRNASRHLCVRHASERIGSVLRSRFRIIDNA